MPARESAFEIVAGLIDGILTALVLAGGTIVDPTAPLTLSLALRVCAASALSGLFVFFVATYAELRGELVRSERELNLSRRGHFATTRLGRQVLGDSVRGAATASAATLVGALFPLGVGLLFPADPWTGILAAILALAALGVGMARYTHGSPVVWTAGLIVMGLLLAFAGIELHLL